MKGFEYNNIALELCRHANMMYLHVFWFQASQMTLKPVRLQYFYNQALNEMGHYFPQYNFCNTVYFSNIKYYIWMLKLCALV